MKNKFIISLLIYTVFFSQKSFSADEKMSESVTLVASCNNQFALSFYNRLPRKQNTCFSPYSLSTAFGMLYCGACNHTANEMEKVFYFPSNIENFTKGSSLLNKHFTSCLSDDLKINIANSLWLQKTFTIESSFKDRLKESFGATIKSADFNKQKETEISRINAWVKKNTFGKITDIVNNKMIQESTKMVLANALYFKARWQSAFDEKMTYFRSFFSDKETFSMVPMMTNEGCYPYFQNSQVSVLELPYQSSTAEGPQFSMLIILPHQIDGLHEVEKNLSESLILSFVHELQTTKVILSLPKFKIEQTIDLKEILINMGMTTSFSDHADFSLLAESNSLKLSNALHKVFLEVDEAGSEAAAVTVITMGLKSCAPDFQTPVLFEADHPFIYAIYEKKSDAILFMGRLVKPLK